MILTTKYRGPTNTQDSCVLVYCGADKAKRVAWDCALDANENHEAAAAEVALRLENRHAHPTKSEISSHESYELPDACNHSRVHIIQAQGQP